jgi:DNA repair protein RecO (recombination protein O)
MFAIFEIKGKLFYKKVRHSMTHKTKGIVLKTIKYGETSLIVTLLTELFGVQTYMVNGVRSSKKSVAKANHFQPCAILEVIVYHNQQKSIQRIKEFNWGFLYQHLLDNVVKNSVAAYMMEVLYKCLKQPEANADLYNFCEAALQQLDVAPKKTTANFALFFTLHLTHFFGFRMTDNYTPSNFILDLEEGVFTNETPQHANYISNELAEITAQLLKVMQPFELEDFNLNQITRRKLLLLYQQYYTLHISDYGQLKTLVILHEVL